MVADNRRARFNYEIGDTFEAGIVLTGSEVKSLRAGIVLTIFAAQVLVCDWLWGRSVAGVYALGVPVAGLYLWRYRWLLAHRARLLAWKVLNPRARALLEARRRRWLRDLNRARDAFAEVLGVAH